MSWTRRFVIGFLVCPVALSLRLAWSLISYIVDLGDFVLTSFED